MDRPRRPFDPASYRGVNRLSEIDKGRAIARCREAGFDPLIPGNIERFTDAALARRRENPAPAEEKRTFSPAEREPWCDRTPEQVERARRDAESTRQASLRGNSHSRW